MNFIIVFHPIFKWSLSSTTISLIEKVNESDSVLIHNVVAEKQTRAPVECIFVWCYLQVFETIHTHTLSYEKKKYCVKFVNTQLFFQTIKNKLLIEFPKNKGFFLCVICMNRPIKPIPSYCHFIYKLTYLIA